MDDESASSTVDYSSYLERIEGELSEMREYVVYERDSAELLASVPLSLGILSGLLVVMLFFWGDRGK